MHRERVSDNVYWFQSEVYAQVTAGVVAGPHWAVVIDTLAMPEETVSIREFIEHELQLPVRYVINTHYHADHSWGNCFFPSATVIAHSNCRKLMLERGVPALENVKKTNPDFRQTRMVLPHITFSEGTIKLRVGKKHLAISPSVGHSPDGIMVLLEEDRVLFAGDSFMPIPYIVDGNIDAITESIKKMREMSLENIIQGHGEVILRGEIETSILENLEYLTNIRKVAKIAARRIEPQEYMDSQSIEDCGKSRVSLGGLAVDLHRNNLKFLYQDARELYLEALEERRAEREKAKAKKARKTKPKARKKAASKTKAAPKARKKASPTAPKAKGKAKPGPKPKTGKKNTRKKSK
ncbi:MBL fold metallo-hydrolase [Chloroflexota bacterium]